MIKVLEAISRKLHKNAPEVILAQGEWMPHYYWGITDK